MGFWTSLFNKLISGHSAGYYEHMHDFKPGPGGTINLCSYGVSVNLTRPQQGFITQLERDYPLLVAALIPEIEKEIVNQKLKLHSVNLGQEIGPIYLIIPACDKQPIEWEMYFVGLAEPVSMMMVSFTGYKLAKVALLISPAKAPAPSAP